MNAISVENLGKCYRVNHAVQRGEYKTLRESLAYAAKAPLRRLRPNAIHDSREEFWALKDVNFEVKPGEVVGIIGRNGAGKSTLLKILSRITKPSSGQIAIAGRVGSLLEVGTGFHPELTGRENIFLNGSILGMRRGEIDRQFDAIVEFAGVEKFLDTPVKRYSSGMYVRLAFAVAAHLDPEILVVDEVLAVGDQAFQKKCIGRMGEIAAGGRTVCLVSHDLPMISRLATRAIWIDAGLVRQQGSTNDVILAYCDETSTGSRRTASVDLQDHPGRRGGRPSHIKRISLLGADGMPSCNVPLGGEVTIELELRDFVGTSDTTLSVSICDTFGTAIAQAHSWIQSTIDLSAARTAIARCTIEDIRLLPGEYRLDVTLGDSSDALDRVDDAIRVTVDPSDIYGTGRVPRRRNGLVALKARWGLVDS
jgi:lipopolysaccharide transport system ATP-binding protein